ncbi:CPBP family intramembrane glutamic endopeptidase [Sorangium sp. So ce1000]|uniref:CPBP family intramembrane glutamic endopeptidase n=1 Tax=Sorangium sp. So ce1000 TaxID=3133325 RepID=UPI003F6416A1
MDLTPIPDATTYGLAILITLGISGSTLASRIQTRFLAVHGVSFFRVYIAVLALTVGWGALVLRSAPLWSGAPMRHGLFAALGVVLGIGATRLELAWRRWIARRQQSRRRSSPAPRQHREAAFHRSIKIRPVRPGAKDVPAPAPKPSARPAGAGVERARFAELLLAAVLEELVFRGYLVLAASELPAPGGAVLLIGAFVGFLLAHVHGGVTDAFAKVPLAVVTTGLAVGSGLVTAAIAAHVAFNAVAWRAVQQGQDVQG